MKKLLTAAILATTIGTATAMVARQSFWQMARHTTKERIAAVGRTARVLLLW